MKSLRLCLTAISLLLITVAIINAENAKTTISTPTPKNVATPKTAPAKEIATAKSVNGKEDETKSVKKGDLGKEKTAGKSMNHSSEESPSEDAQEDLGVNDANQGPTIPAYQIPEQPKDVKKKKRWVGDSNIEFAIDNALGAIFGRPPQPVDTVIEEVTYVDEYPPGPIVYKRSKGLPAASETAEKEIKPSQDLIDSVVVEDAVDTVSLKGDPIAVSKPEIEASKLVTLKNEQKGNVKMEVGNEVTILPAINEEKDFGSSAENSGEMKYQRIAPEVAGLIKKSVPNSGEVEVDEKASEEEEEENKASVESKDEKEEELQDTEMKDEKSDNKVDEKKGQKEFVPVYAEEDEKSEASENRAKDDPKAAEMEKAEESEEQKEDSEAADEGSRLEETNDETKDVEDKSDSSEKINEDEKVETIPKETQHFRESEVLPNNSNEDGEEESDKAAKNDDEVPLEDRESKKIPEEKNNKPDEKAINRDVEAENIEKDEYSPSDDKIAEDKVKIDAINPESPEIIKSKPDKNKNLAKEAENDDKLGSVAYPSEIRDDFSVDHKTGLMPAVSISSSSNNNNADEANLSEAIARDDEKESGDDYYVLQKIQDDVDAASKKDQNPDYIVVEELKDPIQGHRKYTILKPTYREFHPKENRLIEEVKKTLDQSKIVKRRSIIPASFEEDKQASSEEENFKDSISRDTVVEGNSNEILLKNVADAIEREDNLRKPKTDQQPMFVPEFHPIPLKKPSGKPSLNEILGIPENMRPIMIEPEGGIPNAFKHPQSNEDEYRRSDEDYDSPQKVVIQSKQKITLIYDDSSEELTKDSSSSESSSSSEEKEIKSQPWIPIMNIAVINDQKSDEPNTKLENFSDNQEQKSAAALSPQQQHSSNSINDPITTKTHEEQHQQQLKQYSNILGNNLVLTLSISPPILIIAGVICLTLLLFKIYWILYSPPQTSIIPQHSAATTPNPDYRIPLSIVTAEKQPI